MLNEKQMEAVNTLKGQVLVVSCPGSGKTTVIVNRTKRSLTVVYLLKRFL